MLGVYLSGTGNTQHCIEKLATLIDENAIVMPLESENIVDVIKNNEIIILGYPTQFSNAPIMVRDFIKDNDIWKNKKILCVTTKIIIHLRINYYSRYFIYYHDYSFIYKSNFLSGKIFFSIV